MKVAKNTLVTMTYTLRRENENGEIIQEVHEDKPFDAILGRGMLLPKFEANLMGLEPGDTYSFPLTPAEGYGEFDETKLMEVNKEIFMNDGVLNTELCKEGAQVWFSSGDGSQPFPGTVRTIHETTVTVDFNPELAGVPLHFSGKILEVRDASELSQGGCGHCHGGCCDSDESSDDCGGGCCGGCNS